MSSAIIKLSQLVPSRGKQKYHAIKCAYKEKHIDYRKSHQYNLTDIAAREEMLVKKISKLEEHARILIDEMNCLGLTENLVILRTLFNSVQELEVERKIYNKMRKILRNEECKRHQFILDNMRENILLKNFYRLKLFPSERNRQSMMKKARKLEKEKDMYDATNDDIDDALHFEIEESDKEPNENMFDEWIKGISNANSRTNIPVSTTLGFSMEMPKITKKDEDETLYERLKNLKMH
jgi:hypothetical protein